jgi:hypothetical protein
MPLRSREPGRGDAAARPGRGAHPHDSHVPRLGGRRRVQRGARHATLLRPPHRRGHVAGRQPGGTAHRRPDAAGRRRSLLPSMGAVRRRGPRGAERAQFHRARIRAARGGRLLGSRALRRLRHEARGRRLEPALRRRRALPPHRRRVRRALAVDARRAARGDEGGAPPGDARLVRPQLPRLALALGRRQGARSRGESVAHAVRRRPLRKRGRPVGSPRLRGRRGGALAMSTPGDTSMATLNEVLRAMEGRGARIER